VVNGFYAAAVIAGGYRVARNGYYSLLRGRTLGIDLLMTIAIIGAALIGEWAEAATVVVLFAIGALLEGLTMDQARHAIRSLMALSPRTANIRTPVGEQQVPVEALVPGDIVVIRPGELVGADGRVIVGGSAVDQASITGESLPVEKQPGDEVFAGTANQRGYLEVEVTRRAGDTTLARIISLVEEAQAKRAPAQRFVDRFASRYTPAVLVLAVLIATVPPLLGGSFVPWLYKALVLLVIACPCALVISTPVSIVAGIARASRSGVLIKGGAFLEAMAGIRVIAFDKTGTLTEGKPVVTDILPCADQDEAAVLTLAAAIESRSEHPLAGAILRAARERGLAWPDVRDFEGLPGRGARAMLGDEPVLIGGLRLFPQAVADVHATVETWQDMGKTVLLIGRSGHLLGLVAVADELRAGAKEAIRDLREAGVHSVVMLTGDNERTAGIAAARLGIGSWRANLLPEQKTQVVEELLREHGSVAMVGDGVNDAPALASASVGIAMGAAGSDTALETADIALMGDDLRRLPYLIRLSRAALRTIHANIAFSIIVKVVFLALTLLGFANLWLAILADTGAALLVIANGMRLLRFDASRRSMLSRHEQ
jgi:Cd2+/Zn2+-exporting ATPase